MFASFTRDLGGGGRGLRLQWWAFRGTRGAASSQFSCRGADPTGPRRQEAGARPSAVVTTTRLFCKWPWLCSISQRPRRPVWSPAAETGCAPEARAPRETHRMHRGWGMRPPEVCGFEPTTRRWPREARARGGCFLSPVGGAAFLPCLCSGPASIAASVGALPWHLHVHFVLRRKTRCVDSGQHMQRRPVCWLLCPKPTPGTGGGVAGQGRPDEVSDPCLRPGSSAPAQKGFPRGPEGGQHPEEGWGQPRRARVSHSTCFRPVLASGAFPYREHGW